MTKIGFFFAIIANKPQWFFSEVGICGYKTVTDSVTRPQTNVYSTHPIIRFLLSIDLGCTRSRSARSRGHGLAFAPTSEYYHNTR